MPAYYVLIRWLHILVLMGMAGMSFYLVSMVSPQIRSELIKKIYSVVVCRWIAVILLITGIALYLLQAGLVGEGWSDMFSAEIVLALLNTSFGQWWILHLILTFILCLALCYQWDYQYLPWLAILSLGSAGLVGHTTVHQGLYAILFSGVQIIHLLAAAFWFGGLIVILRVLPYLNQPSTSKAAIISLKHFSTAGHIAVLVLLIAGLINIVSVIGWPLWLIYSPYMVLLATKLICIALLIVLAMINRYCLVPWFSVTYVKRAFCIMTCIELIILLTVMALSTTLATYSPMQM